MPIILNGKNLVGGELNGKKLKAVYNGSKLIWQDAPASPTFDAATGNATLTDVVTWSHTAAGPVVVFAYAERTLSSPVVSDITATYGGVGMSKLGEIVVAGSRRGAVFGLLTPAGGSQTVQVNNVGSGGTNRITVGHALSYNNVSSFGAANTNSGTGAPANLTVPAAAGELVAQFFYNASGITGYNQTSRNTTAYSLAGDAPGAASVPFSATPGHATLPWAALSVRLQP